MNSLSDNKEKINNHKKRFENGKNLHRSTDGPFYLLQENIIRCLGAGKITCYLFLLAAQRRERSDYQFPMFCCSNQCPYMQNGAGTPAI